MARKVTRGEFSKFQKEFTLWVGRFGLGQYRYSFLWEAIEDAEATVLVDNDSMRVVVTLAKQLEEEDRSVEQLALHEALHVLLGRFSDLACRRWVGEKDLTEAEEQVVCILERVLGGG